ncbi:MAG: hypothetical protein IJ829_03545, partial [Kiritimatiellae bacterium]|nr:hypothetical protein [Kiritimatiellia bacterium]
MKTSLRLSLACALAACAARGGVLYHEDFMNYSDYAPCVTRDAGLKVYVDGVWAPHGELTCAASRPLDALAKDIAAPEGGDFNFEMRFNLLGKDPKIDRKTKEVIEPGEPSWFDIVLRASDGRRETLRIASDSLAGTRVEFIRRGWRDLALKVRGREVEVLYAEDRGHEMAGVAKKTLPFAVAALNVACTPERRFGVTDLRMTTPDVPVRDCPASRHFASFASLAQPLAGAKVAASGETCALGGPKSGVRFTFDGDTNRTVQVGYVGADGKEVVWTGAIAALDAERGDARIVFAHSPLGEQWVRPAKRPFCENSEVGQRGMVPSGYDVLREWNRLPAASRHVFTLVFEKAPDGWLVFLDGSLAATFSSAAKGGGERAAAEAKAFFFRPGAGVRYAALGAADLGTGDPARFRPLDFAANPR